MDKPDNIFAIMEFMYIWEYMSGVICDIRKIKHDKEMENETKVFLCFTGW